MDNNHYPYNVWQLFQIGCLIAKARNKYHSAKSFKISRQEMTKILETAFPKYSKERIQELVDFEMDGYDALNEAVLKPFNIDLKTIDQSKKNKTHRKHNIKATSNKRSPAKTSKKKITKQKIKPKTRAKAKSRKGR